MFLDIEMSNMDCKWSFCRADDTQWPANTDLTHAMKIHKAFWRALAENFIYQNYAGGGHPIIHQD